ncbi:MAG: hypothetical protein ACKO13_15315, partial [Cytophagales bacterium]
KKNNWLIFLEVKFQNLVAFGYRGILCTKTRGSWWMLRWSTNMKLTSKACALLYCFGARQPTDINPFQDAFY